MDYEGHLKGLSLKFKTFLAPEMATSEARAILGPKKSRFLGTGPSNGTSNPCALRKIIIYWAVRKASACVVSCT